MRRATRKPDGPTARQAVEPPAKERFEILVEELKSEFRAVAEGHGVLNRKIDDLSTEIKEEFATVSARIDSVARELAAHRVDTEVHAPKYKVSDG